MKKVDARNRNSGLLASTSSTIIERANITEKKMALTFDAGSDVGNTYKILNILSNHSIKSTFFLTGQYAELHPNESKDILMQGHEIGNHSYSHPDMTKISPSSIKLEISKAENNIFAAIGKLPVYLFRPPYGSYNSTVLNTVGELGYKYTIMWTIDTVDWNGTSADVMIKKVSDNAKPGAIVLMHVGSGTNTTSALPAMIENLSSKGYKMTTISDLLAKVSSPGTISYTVQKGDTLTKIAVKYGVTVEDIVKLNNISTPDLIYPGQVIAIPIKHLTYSVQRGDTLWVISKKFGVTVDDIVKANNISNPSLIYPGQVLIIPVKN